MSSEIAQDVQSSVAKKAKSWWKEQKAQRRIKILQSLEKKYQKLVRKAAEAFQLEDLKQCLLEHDWEELCVGLLEGWFRFSTVITNRENVQDTFIVLENLWDSLNPALLAHLINNLGDEGLKKKMRNYLDDLQKDVKVKHLAGVWSGDLPKGYKKVTMVLGDEWKSRAPTDLEELRLQLCDLTKSNKFIPKIVSIDKDPALCITFGISVFLEVDENLYAFLQKNDIENVIFRGCQIPSNIEWVRRYKRKATVKNFCIATSKISTIWYLLGQNLELPTHELDEIDRNYVKTDHKQSRMFSVWKSRDQDCSWHKLIKVINQMGYHALAGEVWDYSYTCPQEQADMEKIKHSSHRLDTTKWDQEDMEWKNLPPLSTVEPIEDNLFKRSERERHRLLAHHELVHQETKERAKATAQRFNLLKQREGKIIAHQVEITTSIENIQLWIDELKDEQEYSEKETKRSSHSIPPANHNKMPSNYQEKLSQVYGQFKQCETELMQTNRNLHSCREYIRNTESTLESCIKELERCRKTADTYELQLQNRIAELKQILERSNANEGGFLSALASWTGWLLGTTTEDDKLAKGRKLDELIQEISGLQQEVQRCKKVVAKCHKTDENLKSKLTKIHTDIQKTNSSHHHTPLFTPEPLV